ncbi:D-alanyl-D-alanine carboxypeptidase family protein [Sneathiella chinensis]|uniref:serine-type D-Ala-D-Ala carboxypeptidase n=1 Tax=Sneathiella chinensis TaxID=349750 RepID=A0ABQ5U5W1_9PROT|nr:D-alanyl-D-alanine carboxypeptidase family protein [Sneathiella chinensis]GLQ07268.1 D-alanyl-D-alanine carboxypeptidase [Sneathiella chinensis]
MILKNKPISVGSLKRLALVIPVVVSAAFTAPYAHAIETAAKQAYLVDMETGAVLLDKKGNELMPPASMSKLMTATMVFERLKEGSLKLDDTFPVSERAWRKGGSKMFVEVNSRVSVSDLLRGIIVQSGNDACIVVAEALAGSEEEFARNMTEHARTIGLEQSTFANATGWPDPNHLMTPHELAELAEYIIRNFPDYYEIFAEKSFKYGKIKQGNRNPLLYDNGGGDGLKTGHTEESGYGLVGSAERDGRRLILVVNGLENAKSRGREAERLLEWGFREFGNYELFTAGQEVAEARVWLGAKDLVPLAVEKDLTVTMSRKDRRSMQVKLVYNEPIPAPILQGTPVARLVISAPDMDSIEVPLVATENIERPGMFRRVTSAIKYVLFGASAN